jgi:hypothetical protein
VKDLMDRDPDVHEVLMETVLKRQANAIPSDEWVARFKND